MSWNPFKKPAPTPEPNPVVSAATLISGAPGDIDLMLLGSSRTDDQLPTNDLLLAVLGVTRRDLAQADGDWRPLWRALLESELWIPVFDAGLEGTEGRAINAMVFQNEAALYVFSDADRVRAFFRSAMPIQGRELSVALADGQTACDMAVKFQAERLILNPGFEDALEVLPLAFGVLARGAIPGGSELPPGQDITPMLPIGGPPPPSRPCIKYWRAAPRPRSGSSTTASPSARCTWLWASSARRMISGRCAMIFRGRGASRVRSRRRCSCTA